MSDESENFTRETTGFQKIWLDTMSRMTKAAFNFSPDSVPPEVLRQIRAGILQALAESWNEFLRSPQFQQGMKQWLDHAIAFRKMSNGFMAKVRKEMQAPSRDDIEAVMLAMRHMETRVLDRVEELARQVERLQPNSTKAPKPNPSARKRPARKGPAKRAPGHRKGKRP